MEDLVWAWVCGKACDVEGGLAGVVSTVAASGGAVARADSPLATVSESSEGGGG